MASYIEPKERGYELIYQKLVMYKDLNAASTVFGGSLSAWMDEASSIYAAKKMDTGRVVTKKISELVFNEPGSLGNLLEIWCKTMKEGRTSMTISTLVLRRSSNKADSHDFLKLGEICCSEFVFVSVDESGLPTKWNHKK